MFVLAAAQALFFWNVLQTLRGKAGVATFDERGIPMPARSTKEWSVHAAEGALVLVVLLLAFAFAVGGYPRRARDGPRRRWRHDDRADEHGRRRGAHRRRGGRGGRVRERRLRRLPHARRRRARPGPSAPRSTRAKPTEALVIERVTNGKGAMPPFAGQLSEQQIADVAAYVHESTQK